MPNRRREILGAATLCVLCASMVAAFAPSAKAISNQSQNVKVASLKKGIEFYRQATWRWQTTALVTPTRTNYDERRAQSVGYLQWVARLWQHRAVHWKRYAQNPPHLAMWLCIHTGWRGSHKVTGGEAVWTDHASHNPHYGGLQLGQWFMTNYAPSLFATLGTADHWQPLQQIWVAEHAYEQEHYKRSWLFGQWGHTAPPCV